MLDCAAFTLLTNIANTIDDNVVSAVFIHAPFLY
jgi:hypothetical protein